MNYSTVYYLINICSCFVMVLKFYIFSAVMRSGRWKGVVMASAYFTDVVLHSSKNYRHERGTTLRRPSDSIQFNSIYFVFDRSKGVVNPQDIEHVNI